MCLRTGIQVPHVPRQRVVLWDNLSAADRTGRRLRIMDRMNPARRSGAVTNKQHTENRNSLVTNTWSNPESQTLSMSGWSNAPAYKKNRRTVSNVEDVPSASASMQTGADVP